MERITTIYSACGKDAMRGERVMEQILEETFDKLVGFGCEQNREIVLKGQMIYVHHTVYVDVIEHDDEPIDVDINYVDIPGLGRVPNKVAPEGYLYTDGELVRETTFYSNNLVSLAAQTVDQIHRGNDDAIKNAIKHLDENPGLYGAVEAHDHFVACVTAVKLNLMR